jgi:tetratricopeptide (TPR) repeat protein
MVDELARGLLTSAVAGSGAPGGDPEPITTSLEALRAYLAGESAFRRGRYPEALDAFRRAVARDTLFALAHHRLAVASEFSGDMDPEGFGLAVDRALRHADRLPWRDRAFLEAFAHYHRGSAVDAEARFREVLAEYPDDVGARYGLAEVLFHAGPRVGRAGALTEAEEAFRTVLTLDPTHVEARLHLVRLAAAMGDRQTVANEVAALGASALDGAPILRSAEVLHAILSEDAALRRERVRSISAEPTVLVVIAAIFVATYAGDLEASLEVAEIPTAEWRPARQRGAAHAFRAQLLAGLGSLEAARRELEAAESLHPRLARRVLGLVLAMPDGSPDPTELEPLRHRLATAADDEPFGSDDLRYLTLTPGMDRVFDLYVAGLLDAALGELDAARARAVELAGLDAAEPRLRDDLARGLRADVLRREGRPLEALAELEGIRFETWHQAAMGSPFHALARERSLRASLLGGLGRHDEARRWSGRLATTPYDLMYGPVAH